MSGVCGARSTACARVGFWRGVGYGVAVGRNGTDALIDFQTHARRCLLCSVYEWSAEKKRLMNFIISDVSALCFHIFVFYCSFVDGLIRYFSKSKIRTPGHGFSYVRLTVTPGSCPAPMQHWLWLFRPAQVRKETKVRSTIPAGPACSVWHTGCLPPRSI